MNKTRYLIRKVIALLLTMAMILGSGVLILGTAADPVAWDGSVASDFAGGSGTEGDPYRISTPAQFAYFAKYVNDGETTLGKYFKLTADIMMNKTIAFTPIAAGIGGWASFKGDFDGDGHTISGVKVDTTASLGTPDEVWTTGLFGCVGAAANIHDFLLSDSSFTGISPVGGVAGMANLGASFSNIYVDADVTVDNALGDGAGGIIGQLTSGKAGETDGARITVDSCVNAGTIMASMVHTKSNEGSHVGGIIGNGNGKMISVTNCLNIGPISATFRYACGIVGRESLANAVVSKCVNFATVTCESSPGTYASEIINSNESTNKPLVSDCYYTGTNPATRNSTTTNVTKVIGFDLWGSDASVTISGWTKRANDVMIPSGVAAFAPASGLPVPHASFSEVPAADPATAFAGGEGTAEAPYQISNVAELQYFANTVSAGETYAGKYLILTDNITLNTTNAGNWDTTLPEKQFLSVGQSATAYFAGDFNGNGKTISGLCIATAGTKDGGLALFAGIQSGANVHDFLLANSYVFSEAGNASVAAVVAAIDLTAAEKTVTIANVYVSDVIINGGGNSGGIAAQVLGAQAAAKVNVKSCVFAGSLTGNGDNVGGIVGNCNTATGVTVSDCLNLGTVTGNSYVAGIVARADAGTVIHCCVNVGAITAKASSGYAADLFVAGKGSLTVGKTTIEMSYHTGAGKKAFYNSSEKDESNANLEYTVRSVSLYALWGDSELSSLSNWTKRTEGTGDIMIPTGVAAFAPASGLTTPKKPADPKPAIPLIPVETSESTTTEAPATTTETKPETTKKGCKSVIGGGIAVIAVICGAGVVLCRKKAR